MLANKVLTGHLLGPLCYLKLIDKLGSRLVNKVKQNRIMLGSKLL